MPAPSAPSRSSTSKLRFSSLLVWAGRSCFGARTSVRLSSLIVWAGLLLGILLTGLYWLGVSTSLITFIFWLSLRLLGAGGLLLLRFRFAKPIPKGLLLLAVLAAVSLEFLPRSFDVNQMRRDVELFEALLPIAVALTQLQELMDDTLIATGNEAYAAALVVYNYAKTSGQGAALDAVADELSRRGALAPPRAQPSRRRKPASASHLS